MKGEKCDISAGCQCGWVVDASGKNCLKTNIPNCVELDITGKKCKKCASPNSYHNYGGGKNDYGLSYGHSQCIDNEANGNPNCKAYMQADLLCAECFSGYLLTKDRKCVKGTVISKCHLYSEDGLKCVSCKYPIKLDA